MVDELCAGDASAREFCTVFVVWCHVIDDVVDRDKPLPTKEDFARIMLEAVTVFAFNPFFKTHRDSLLPLVIQSTKAYEDSLAWAASPDLNKRRAADVLKSQYQDVLWQVAFLCGGYGHLDAMTKRWRHYQFDAH
jgi:hypothetical protein